MPEPLGSTTYTVFLYGVEEDKLHLEFEVNTAQTIYKGMPVKLSGSGEKIEPLDAGDNPFLKCIGYSIHDGEAGDLVTVAMRSFTVIWGEAEDSFSAGPVKYIGFDTENADGNLAGYNRFSDAGPVDVTTVIGWAIDDAAAEGDKVRVVLIG